MPTTDSIQIRIKGAGRPIVFLPYSSGQVATIKTLAGPRWHQQEQHWTVPQTNEAITHLLEAGYSSAVPYTAQAGDIRTVQELLGHSDVMTTIMIYTHVLNRGGSDCQWRW